MHTEFSPATVLKPTSWCSVREQEEQYLIYNSKTDELHLLPPMAFLVLQLCDGLTSIAGLENFLLAAFEGEPQSLKPLVHKLLVGFVNRGILETDNDEIRS